MTFADEDFPAVPYPGRRPDTSYVHDDATGWAITPDPVALSGWRVGDADLDDWLAERDAAPLAERVPVLCYGSNVCPSKLTWLRDALGLPGPAVLVRARCRDLAAVWAAGQRVVDDQRPATLAALPGNVEDHAVWWATPEQVRVLDRCEGRGERYRLVRLDSGEVRLADGSVVDGPLAYTATPASDDHPARLRRQPLLMAGAPVRCLDVPQAGAAALTGVAAASDGLTVREVDGAPDPADFPGRLFVYGTLRPDASEWRRLAPFADGTPTVATLPGALYDTGLGYPALRLEPGPGVHGWVVDLVKPAAALAEMDAYEGAEYRRVRVALPGGLISWTYVWIHPFEGFRMLTAPWG